MKTLLITGGRNYAFTQEDRAFLDALNCKHGFVLLIEGGCRRRDYRGDFLPTADYDGYCWARSRDIQPITMDANWAHNNRAAGPIRNSVMVLLASKLNALVVVFPGGRGTADCATKAEAFGLKVIRRP